MHVSTFLAGWQRCISGCGFAHFYHYGPIKLEYTIDRFTMEAKPQLHVLDQRLAGRPFIPGKDCSVADIASFPSVGEHLTQRKFLSVHEYSNVLRWAESLVERPAAGSCRAPQHDLSKDERERPLCEAGNRLVESPDILVGTRKHHTTLECSHDVKGSRFRFGAADPLC